MDALDDVADTDEKSPKVRKKLTLRACRKTKKEKSEVITLDMPTQPACVGRPNGEATTTKIYVYKSAGSGKGWALWWLRTDCLDWLLGYAADQLHFQNVPRPSVDSADLQTPNCPAVADMHLEWQFDAKAWDAEFVAGKYAGTRKRFLVADLNKGRWQKLQKLSLVDEDWPLKSRFAKRDGAKALMIAWCEAIVNDKGPAFEREWGLCEPLLTTPVKQRRVGAKL